MQERITVCQISSAQFVTDRMFQYTIFANSITINATEGILIFKSFQDQVHLSSDLIVIQFNSSVNVNTKAAFFPLRTFALIAHVIHITISRHVMYRARALRKLSKLT